MFHKQLVNILIAVLFIASSSCYAINKCTDENGKVSYQDAPCLKRSASDSIKIKSDRDSDNLDNVHTVAAKIPGIGEVVAVSYNWWNDQVIDAKGNRPLTIKMRSKQGEEPLSLSMTFIPNLRGKSLSLDENADLVSRMSLPYVNSSIEKEVNLGKVDTTIGTAILASFNEEKYQNSPVPKGEYSTITVGHVSHSKLSIAITILTNGSESKALKEAINVISSFQVAAKK